MGQACAVPWIPGCRWMLERAAAGRSLPPWAARPRRPRGRRSEGSSWRRGNGVGSRRNSQARFLRRAARWVAQLRVPGTPIFPQAPMRPPLASSPPRPCPRPRAPAGGGERAPLRPPPPRWRQNSRDCHRQRVSRLRLSSLAPEKREAGRQLQAGLRGQCRVTGQAGAAGESQRWGLGAHPPSRGDSLAGVVEIQTKPRMNRKPVNDLTRRNHLQQLIPHPEKRTQREAVT